MRTSENHIDISAQEAAELANKILQMLKDNKSAIVVISNLLGQDPSWDLADMRNTMAMILLIVLMEVRDEK
jgi:predicted ATP-grasp superfamily ATP-dependent carboligase